MVEAHDAAGNDALDAFVPPLPAHDDDAPALVGCFDKRVRIVEKLALDGAALAQINKRIAAANTAAQEAAKAAQSAKDAASLANAAAKLASAAAESAKLWTELLNEYTLAQNFFIATTQARVRKIEEDIAALKTKTSALT